MILARQITIKGREYEHSSKNSQHLKRSIVLNNTQTTMSLHLVLFKSTKPDTTCLVISVQQKYDDGAQ